MPLTPKRRKDLVAALNDAADEGGWVEAGVVKAHVGGPEAQCYQDLDELVLEGSAVRKKTVRHYGIEANIVDKRMIAP